MDFHAVVFIFLCNDGATVTNFSMIAPLSTGYRESTLMLVDLAGSERAAASEGKSSLRLEEAKAINLSLSALGK